MTPELHVERFLEEIKPKYSNHTFDRMKLGLKYYLKFLRAERLDTVHLGPEVISKFRDHLYFERSYQVQTAWQCARSVRHFYEYLRARDIVQENPVLPYRFKRPPVKERHYTDEEILRAYVINWRKLYTSPSRIEDIYEEWKKIKGIMDKLDIRLQTMNRDHFEEIAKELDKYPKRDGAILYRHGRSRCLWLLKGILQWMYNNGYRKDNPGWRFKYNFSLDIDIVVEKEVPYAPIWQEYMTKFIQDCRSRWRPNTVEVTQRYTRQFFKYLTEQNIQDIHQINVDILEGYRGFVYEQDHIVEATKYSKVTVVRYFMNWLEKTDQILSNPTRKMNWPKQTRGLPTPLMSPHEVMVLMSAPDIKSPYGLRNRAIFELMYSTGMRVGEAGGVRIEDIDFENGLVRINNPKGGPSFQRVVPVGQIALQWVKRYIDEARHYFPVQDGCERVLFLSKTGGPITALTVSGAMRHYCMKQGMRKLYSSHSWRVTCATHMLRNRADIRHVQEQLGHHCLDSTKIYTRLFPTDLKKVHQKTHPREREYRRQELKDQKI